MGSSNSIERTGTWRIAEIAAKIGNIRAGYMSSAALPTMSGDGSHSLFPGKIALKWLNTSA